MAKAKKNTEVRSEVVAKCGIIRSSERKLNLVAQLIRGMDVSRALNELEFSARRVSGEVKKVLQSVVANAENNHNFEVDRLYVSEAYVGKGMVMKRWRARAKGRGARIEKPFSKITIVVKERTGENA